MKVRSNIKIDRQTGFPFIYIRQQIRKSMRKRKNRRKILTLRRGASVDEDLDHFEGNLRVRVGRSLVQRSFALNAVDDVNVDAIIVKQNLQASCRAMSCSVALKEEA